MLYSMFPVAGIWPGVASVAGRMEVGWFWEEKALVRFNIKDGGVGAVWGTGEAQFKVCIDSCMGGTID